MITTTDHDHVAMVDSVTGLAFGPTFGSAEQIQGFLRWCRTMGLPDLRSLTNYRIEALHNQYLSMTAVAS